MGNLEGKMGAWGKWGRFGRALRDPKKALEKHLGLREEREKL